MQNRPSVWSMLLLLSVLAILLTQSCGEDDTPILGTIKGSIESKNGEKIDPVRIKIINTEGSDNTDPVTSTQGEFIIGGLDLATYSVTATKEGFVQYISPVNIRLTDDRFERTLNIQMIPLGSLNGTVTNRHSNESIPGVNISLTEAVTNTVTITSNTEGFYSFDQLKAGVYSLRALKDGYKLLEQSVTIIDGNNTPFDLSLTPFPSISGTILDITDDSPLNQVTVALTGESAGDLLTDDNGEFKFPNLGEGEYTLIITKDGFESIQEPVTLRDGESISRIFNLTRTPVFAMMSGHVANKLTEETLPDAKISLSGPTTKDVLSDASGNYSFTQLDPGEYSLSVEKGGFEIYNESIELDPSEETNKIILLNPWPNLSGTVLRLDDEGPMEDVKVTLNGPIQSDVLTDPLGKFIFEKLEPGEYVLIFSEDGFESQQEDISLEAGNSVDKVIKLEKIEFLYSISGQIINSQSQAPLTGITLSLEGPTPQDLSSGTNGDFLFSSLKSGDYILKVNQNGFEGFEEVFTLKNEQNKNVIINLVPLGSIEGTVLDLNTDTPLANVEVSLSGATQTETLTDSQGKFQFGSLKAGSYTVRISKQSYEPVEQSLEVSPSQNSIQVYKLVPTPSFATLKGQVVNNETQQGISQVKLTLSGPTSSDIFSDENGNYEFLELETGSYTINANKSGFESKEKSIDLSEGEEKNLIVSLIPINAELSVTPTTLDFLDTKTTLPIEISNTGQGTLTWEIVEDIPWLTISDESGVITGSERKTVTITVNRESLGQGSHNNSFTVSSNAGNKTINARVEVKPQLCVTPTDLNFGTTTEAKSVSLENCGNGTIEYSVVPNSDWIKVSTTSGTVTREKDPISIAVDHTGLSPGNYTGQVIFNSASSNTEVVVVMTVPNLNEPQLTLSEEALEFGTNQATRVITVTNTGKQTLNWNLAKEQNWISISDTNGSLIEGESENITIQVFRSGLASNNYEGNLEFTSNGGQRNVPVKMTVAATPILQQSTQFLDFGYETKQLSFDIANVGNATLQWQIETDVNWITVVPKTGTEAASITVFVNRDNVGDGSYSGNITINSNGGVGVIAISMIKAPPPPNMTLESVEFKSDVNESGTPNPGESVTYTVKLKNDNGASEGKDIKVEFSGSGPYVNSFSPSEVSFGNVPINESIERDVTINFSTLAEVGQTVDINMTIKDVNGQSWSENFQVEMKSFFVVSQGLLAYYRFDQGAFKDETGNHKGRGFGPEHTSDTPDGQGLSIEFKAEEEDFFQTAKNIIGWQKQGTFNFWIKTKNNNIRLFTSSLLTSDQRNRITISSNNKILANSQRYNSTNFVTDIAPDLLDGNWHMLTVSIKKYQHRFYIDGDLYEEHTNRNELEYTSNSEGFLFGKRPNNDMFYNGKMDNIRIYNRVLTEDEVKLLFEKKQ